MALGNVSISSLISSAESSAKKSRAYQDRVAAFEWENSQKNEGDYLEYLQYLQNRQEGAVDPSERLSYETTIRSARRGYISEELQRETIRIVQGGGSTLQKLNRALELADLAYQNGDLNSAQNIYAQALNLEVKWQNEQMAQYKSSIAQAKSNARNATIYRDKVLKEDGNVWVVSDKTNKLLEIPTLPKIIREFESNPDGFADKYAYLAKEFGEGTEFGYLDAIATVMEAAVVHLRNEGDKYVDIDPTITMDLYEKADSFANSNVTIAGHTFNGYQEIQETRVAEHNLQPRFNVVTTLDGKAKLEENKGVNDVIYVRRADGTIGTQRPVQETIFDDKLSNTLREAGLTVVGRDEDGKNLLIRTEAGELFGVNANIRTEATVTDEGRVKFVDPDTGKIMFFDPANREFIRQDINPETGELSEETVLDLTPEDHLNGGIVNRILAPLRNFASTGGQPNANQVLVESEQVVRDKLNQLSVVDPAFTENMRQTRLRVASGQQVFPKIEVETPKVSEQKLEVVDKPNNLGELNVVDEPNDFGPLTVRS